MVRFPPDTIIAGAKLENVWLQQNSINGTAEYQGSRVFYKIADDHRLQKEEHGYHVLENYLPQPKFLGYHKIDDIKSMVLYEHVPELEQYEHLLLGWIRQKSVGELICSKAWNQVCSLLQNMHAKTMIADTLGITKEIFRRSNVLPNGKLDNRYGSDWERLDYLLDINEVAINGNSMSYNWSQYKKNLRDFGTNKEETVMATIHGSATEMHICMLPMFFDITTAGTYPVMSELFMFNLSASFTDEYVVPRFFPLLVPRFPEVLEDYREEYGHEWTMREKSIIVDFTNPYPSIRESLLKSFNQQVTFLDIEQGLEMLPQWDWKNEYTQYTISRLLSLFNLPTLPESDQALLLTHMAQLYDWMANPDQYSTIPHIGGQT
mgnify:CR=1 FL=1|tara:strand:+ start:4980 stop:6110 length:1131 start_codon:yes stop_codon:yes gene_type:complete